MMIALEIQKTIDVMEEVLADDELRDSIEKIAKTCVNAIRNGNKIMFCGNGGSAADSQHLAAELVSRLNFDRAGMAGIALTTDTSALTAIANDYGFEQVFSRQLNAIGKPGDILFAISTSGNSINILKAIEYAHSAQIIVVGMTGEVGGSMRGACQLIIKVPSQETQKIQECHIMIGHIICGLIEKGVFS